MVTLAVSLDASITSDHVDVDKNIVFVALGPEEDKAIVTKNIAFIALGPEEDKAIVTKNVIFVALGPERILRRTVFVTHGE